jgi:hypothetical protein
MIGRGQPLDRGRWSSTDVEFKSSGNHHHRPFSISILIAHIALRCIAADEEAAAVAALLLNDPVSAAVLADHEDGMSLT